MIFCEACGSVCYRRGSKNHKGEYQYYHCGCRHRNGNDACENAASVREDVLIARITQTFDVLFQETDSIIEDAIEEARKLLDSNRDEAKRIRGQLAEADRKIGSLTRLLMDPDIGMAAKKAISRQLGEEEADRDRLQQAISELADRANDSTGRLAGAVRQALVEARQSLDAVATGVELRDFVERWVAPMVLRQDGSIAQRESAAEFAADVKGVLAGARSGISSRPESGLVFAFAGGAEGVSDA